MEVVRRETEAPRGFASWRAEPVPLRDTLHILGCEAVWVPWVDSEDTKDAADEETDD